VAASNTGINNRSPTARAAKKNATANIVYAVCRSFITEAPSALVPVAPERSETRLTSFIADPLGENVRGAPAASLSTGVAMPQIGP